MMRAASSKGEQEPHYFFNKKAHITLNKNAVGRHLAKQPAPLFFLKK
jgi:hypothetical protein